MSTQALIKPDKNSPARYCCDKSVVWVKDCPIVIRNINGGDIPLLVYPDNNTNNAPVDTGIIVGEGTTLITDPGRYALDFDCDVLEGERVDPQNPITVTCEQAKGTTAEYIKLCEILTAINENGGGDVVIDLESVVTAIDNSGQTAAQWCAADATFQASLLALMETVVNNTAAITGIETAFGQLGCIFVDGVQTGSVLVCKVSPEDGSDSVTQVHAYFTDGTVDTNYTGAWEPCTNLNEILTCLNALKDKAATPFKLWGVRIDRNTVDNHSIGEPRPDGPGIVAWPQDEHEITLTLSDGSVCKAPWPAWDGTGNRWLASNTALAAAIAQCTGKPWEFSSAGSDGNPNTGWGGHAASDCCPSDLHVVSAFATVASEIRNGRVIPLATSYTKGEVTKYKQVCCLGQPDQWFAFGSTEPLAEAPDLSCAAVDCHFAEAGVVQPDKPECLTKFFGPLNDCLFSADPDVEPETLATDIYVDVESCDGIDTTLVYTLDGEGLPEPYEVQGELANPDKTVFEAEPECPAGPWEAVQIQRKLNILDNSLWDNAPSIHIGVGNFPATQIEVLWSDGTSGVFDWPGGTNMYGGFRAWLIEQTGCVYFDAVANWTGLPTNLPWGLTDADVPRECLFARGWSLMCCVGGKCVDTASVIQSADAAWVGATKKAWDFDGPKESVYVTHAGCNAVYKDCDGKILDLPAGCCPVVDDTLAAVKGVKTVSGERVTYTNTDEETELTISIGANGDIKIGSGSGDGSDAEITQFITDCLAAGKNVEWKATGFEGEKAFGTMLANAQTQPFPNFYNESTDAAPSGAFKVRGFVAEHVGEETFYLNVHDCQVLDKLCSIEALLTCIDCPELEMGQTTNTDDGSVVSFPLAVTGGFVNHTTPMTISDPSGCLAANPEALISVLYEVDHEAGPYDVHRAYVLNASAGTFTAMSASNTQPQNGTAGIGQSSIFIGYAAGDPTANQRNVRWVKLTATAAEWLAGISLSAVGFGGVGGSTETIHSRTIKVCEGIEAICDGC